MVLSQYKTCILLNNYLCYSNNPSQISHKNVCSFMSISRYVKHSTAQHSSILYLLHFWYRWTKYLQLQQKEDSVMFMECCIFWYFFILIFHPSMPCVLTIFISYISPEIIPNFMIRHISYFGSWKSPWGSCTCWCRHLIDTGLYLLYTAYWLIGERVVILYIFV